MLAKETILHLQEEKVVQVLNETFNEHFDSRSESTPGLVVPERFAIKNLESMQEHRNNFRGTFDTSDINSFVDYCAHYLVGERPDANAGDGQIFVSNDTMRANAIFDIGSEVLPGHCRHNAFLKLPKGAAFQALEAIVDRKLSQEDFSNFLEDWKNIVTAKTNSESPIDLPVAITEVRKVTIESAREIESSIGNFENSASVSERIGAKNKDNLPAYIDFKCFPYLGLSERSISLRVSMLTGSAAPIFVLRIVGSESLDEELGVEFMELIKTKCKKHQAKIFVGQFSS